MSNLFVLRYLLLGARLVIDNEKQLGITEYSVSEATLEQVFLHLARTEDDSASEKAGQTEAKAQDSSSLAVSIVPATSPDSKTA
jgi:hypothetical protein